MAKHNNKGRSKGTSFVMLERYLLRSPAYRSLHPYARALLVEIKCQYDGKNNGFIHMGVRDAIEALGVGRKATERAFDELQDRGFIRVAKKGRFTVKEATTWTLTDVPIGDELSTKDFMRWKEKVPEKQNIVLLRDTVSAPEGHCNGIAKGKNSVLSAPEGHCNPDLTPPLSAPEGHTYNIPPGPRKPGRPASQGERDRVDGLETIDKKEIGIGMNHISKHLPAWAKQ